jgi:hypothetical protein
LQKVFVCEVHNFFDTDGRLFGNLFTVEDAKRIEADPILAERLDAFVSRLAGCKTR